MFVDDNITTGVEGRSTKVQAVWHTGVEAGGEKKRTNARQDPTAGPRTAHAHVQHQQTGQRHDNDGKSL